MDAKYPMGTPDKAKVSIIELASKLAVLNARVRKLSELADSLEGESLEPYDKSIQINSYLGKTDAKDDASKRIRLIIEG